VVLLDLPTIQKQSLKSADDWYNGILKNKLKNLETLRQTLIKGRRLD
jgi:hypothetical protein